MNCVDVINLDSKIVLHIPEKAYVNDKLVDIPAKRLMKKLIDNICGIETISNYHLSCYVTSVKSFYKGRKYPEKLITVFAPVDTIATIRDIFSQWFAENNNILCQESMAYEVNHDLFIKPVITQE